MASDENTLDYFDLIVEIAKKVAEMRPEDVSMNAYLRKRMQDAFHKLNSSMSAGWFDVRRNGWEGQREMNRTLCNDLARECFIIAWYFGIQDEDGEDSPETVARLMTETTVQGVPRL